MTIVQMIRAKLDRRKAEKEAAARMAKPLDGELPFGLHIDGKIEIKVLLPESVSSRFVQGAHVIEGFGVAELFGYRSYRVLLRPESGGTDAYLLIFQKGDEVGVRWFVNFDDVHPSSEEEWDFWLNEKDGSIGISQFAMADKTLYDRIWGGRQEYMFDPVAFTERLVLDRYDAAATQVIEQRSMLYGRKVEDDVCPCDEFVLLSAYRERDASYVSIDVGVDLDFNVNVKVIY